MVTNDQKVYERATLLGHFKVRAFEEVQSDRYRAFAGTGYGMNYRMHPLGAALANSQFQRLDQYLASRNENLSYLSDGLRGLRGIQPPNVKPYATRHAWFSYKPLYRSAELGGLRIETYLEALQAEGMPIARSQSRPLHLEPLF
jgi:dTDP-4-amino-4,6-dideoxygalactose transaminase